MPTCKDCLGKKQHSVLAHITSRGDLGGKDYTFTRYTMQDCSRCKGTGFEYPPMPSYIPISPDVFDETGVECISFGTTENYILGCLIHIIIWFACMLSVIYLLSYLY